MEVEAFQKQRHHQDTAPNKRAAQRAVADYKFGGPMFGKQRKEGGTGVTPR